MMQRRGYFTSTCARQEEGLRNSIITRRKRVLIMCAEKWLRLYPDLTVLLWCSTRIRTWAGRGVRYSIWLFFVLLLSPQQVQRKSLINLEYLLVMMVLLKKSMSNLTLLIHLSLIHI